VTKRREDAYEQMFELAVALGDLMDDGLSDRGLTRSRAELLWRLHHQGPMTQRQLSDALRCTPRNVTGLLDGLQADGLVERRPHPADRRATLVTLTKEGSKTLTRLDGEYQQSANKIFAGLPAADLAAFVRTVEHVLTRLRRDD
jgi:DNA-binding MarR family transcriptional regulator